MVCPYLTHQIEIFNSMNLNSMNMLCYIVIGIGRNYAKILQAVI